MSISYTKKLLLFLHAPPAHYAEGRCLVMKEFLVLARTKSFSTKTLTSHSAVHTYAVVIGEEGLDGYQGARVREAGGDALY